MNDLGDKIDSDAKGRLQAAIERVREAVKAENVSAMKETSEALQKLWHEEAGRIYAQTGGAPGPEPQAEPSAETSETPAGEDQGPVEADFEVVDEDKKK